jgi:hypothetical protein
MTSSGGRTGIAPAYLLDVEDANENCYYWATRKITAPSVIVGTGGSASNPYVPWIVRAPQLSFHRSKQVNTGTLQLQNLSGDTLQSDFKKIVRKTTLEGALAVLRRWNAAAQAAEREFHCTLSFTDSNPEIATLQLRQLDDASQESTPRYLMCEICQWRWSSAQCGSTASTPCQQSYPTCQVIERIFVIMNNYEKNYGETTANTSTYMQNRARQI